MNITLIAFSIIFIIASVHALFRDKLVKFDKISKAAIYIFIFNLLFYLYAIIIGTTEVMGEYTFFMISFAMYVIMSGNILHHIKYVKKKEF